ncbi:MAG: M20 family peptidase [Gemmataceae bacterium]
MSRYLKTGTVLLIVLVAVFAWNTFTLPLPTPVFVSAAMPPIDENAAAQRLAGAVRIPTVSYEDRSLIDPAQLDAFATYLQQTFPRVTASLTREVVNGHSLLYTWPGSDPSAQPILLLAHMDVVPVEPGSEPQWTHAPFSGDIADGYVWGRGTLDDKDSLMAWMESAEHLLAEGFKPRRTIYFAFGDDEEIGGAEGAKQIAALLRSRGVVAEFSLDEGGAITEGIIQGAKRPVATIMSAEKGYLSLRLTAHAPGGHSSMPSPETAIGRLARAVAHLQNRPMPAHMVRPVKDMLDRLAPDMPLLDRIILANRWLLRPLILAEMTRTPASNALVRTTSAPTILRAGMKDNVLPTQAYAVVNFRLLPHDTIADVERHVRLAMADDGIAITQEGDFAAEASPVSDTHSAAFSVIAQTVHDIFPQALVTTGIVTGATDTRNYAGLFVNRYNFSPSVFGPQDLARVHGANERIGVADYANMIRFGMRLLHNAAG